MSLPGDLWPGAYPQQEDGWKDPADFESRDGLLVSLRLRFFLFLRRLGLRH